MSKIIKLISLAPQKWAKAAILERAVLRLQSEKPYGKHLEKEEVEKINQSIEKQKQTLSLNKHQEINDSLHFEILLSALVKILIKSNQENIAFSLVKEAANLVITDNTKTISEIIGQTLKLRCCPSPASSCYTPAADT